VISLSSAFQKYCEIVPDAPSHRISSFGQAAASALMLGTAVATMNLAGALFGASMLYGTYKRSLQATAEETCITSLKDSVSRILGLLCEDISKVWQPDTTDGEKSLLHFTALAVQFLSLAFQSYLQANTGKFDLPFLEPLLAEVRLQGSIPNREIITATCQELSCLGEMIGNPVLVFKLHRKMYPTLGLQGANTRKKWDLEATPEHLVDIWGASSLIRSSDNTEIRAIRTGGGWLFCEDGKFLWHWSAEQPPIEKLQQPTSLDLETRIRVGATTATTATTTAAATPAVTCPFNIDRRQQLLQSVFKDTLPSLGTVKPYWKINQLQIGLGGGQYANLHMLGIWSKLPGTTVKDRLLENCNGGRYGEVFPDLHDSPYGLHVSLCTGVAKRVTLEHVLHTEISDMERRDDKPREWTTLGSKLQEDIKQALQAGSFKSLRSQLKHDDREKVERLAGTLINILNYTGVNENSTLMVSCITKSGNRRGFPIECARGNRWGQILTDSESVATFAIIASQCLPSPRPMSHQCGSLRADAEREKSFADLPFQLHTKLLAGTRHRQGGMNLAELKKGRRYYIGNNLPVVAYVAESNDSAPALIHIKARTFPSIFRKIQRVKEEPIVKESFSVEAEDCIIISK
jgi:hypothetical protein